MTTEMTEAARRSILLHIAAEFDSDAAFERAMGLAPKTVNNWRRGLSASFMKMLPRMAEELRVTVGELLDLPVDTAHPDLSPEEAELIALYRKTRVLPAPKREALDASIRQIIALYLSSAETAARRAKRKENVNP